MFHKVLTNPVVGAPPFPKGGWETTISNSDSVQDRQFNVCQL